LYRSTGRPHVDERLIDGSRRRVRTSASWRDQPVEHGPYTRSVGCSADGSAPVWRARADRTAGQCRWRRDAS